MDIMILNGYRSTHLEGHMGDEINARLRGDM